MSKVDFWEKWTSSFCETTINTYRNEPKRIREDFGSETRVKDDYKGRVLLELLQNADDAQISENPESIRIGYSQVIFYLTPNAFYCANGGYPISPDGMEAICRLSHSPKKDKNKYIGEKGLGFKSVLCFTNSPEIHSEGLHCKFDRNKAAEYILNSEVKTNYNNDTKQVALFRFPLQMEEEDWKTDSILVDLLKDSATVIKLNISEQNFFVLKEKLQEIRALILLFLNNLNMIKIQIHESNGENKDYLYAIENINSGDTNNSYILKDGNNKETIWDVFSNTIEVSNDFIGDIDDTTFQGVNACRVSFAIQKNERNEYIPTHLLDKNFVRVYFPTREVFPLPFLFHATYYTDSSRKSINLEHTYNKNLTQFAIETFIGCVLPQIIINRKENVCAHIDLLVTSISNISDRILNQDSDKTDVTIGEWFCIQLYKELSKLRIIPNINGELKSVDEVLRLPFNKEQWEMWYSIFSKHNFKNLIVVNEEFSKNSRLQLLDHLGVSYFSYKDIINALENNAVANVDYFIDIYKLLKEMIFNSEKYGEDRSLIAKYCKEKDLVITSDIEIVNSTSVRIFMYPDKGEFTRIPDWLGVKFINPELVEGLGTNKLQVLNDYLDIFGIKRFQSREVLREVLSKSIKDYWEGTKDILNEKELLEFCYELLEDELADELIRPEKDTYRIIKEIPVPSNYKDGEIKWVKAGECYFGSEWLENDFLEMLYTFEDSNFICNKDYFIKTGVNIDRVFRFLYFIGVENKPRIIEFSHKELSSHYDSDKYWNYITKKYEHLTYDTNCSWRFTLKTNYTVEHIHEILNDIGKSKIFLNYLAHNMVYYSSFNYAYIEYRPYKSPATYSKTIEDNYLKWLLYNYKWLSDEKGNRYCPKDIYIIEKSSNKNLNEYLPYVSYEIQKNQADFRSIKSFLINLGVNDSITSLDLRQWYSILFKISNTNSKKVISENDAEKIRSIYRTFLRSEITFNDAQGKGARETFINYGSVLAMLNNEYRFFPVKDVLYADKLELFNQLRLFTPCFQVETNREARVAELFGIPSLSKSLHEIPEFGEEDKIIKDIVVSFLNDAKSYILARISKQRDLKSEISVIKNLQVIPVKYIRLQSKLKHGTFNWEKEIPYHEVDSYVMKPINEQKSHIIYINSRIISSSEYSDLRNQDNFIIQLAGKLCEILEVDLREAFQLLLSSSTKSKLRILRSNDIEQEKINECKVMLNFEEEIIESDKEMLENATSEGTNNKGMDKSSVEISKTTLFVENDERNNAVKQNKSKEIVDVNLIKVKYKEEIVEDETINNRKNEFDEKRKHKEQSSNNGGGSGRINDPDLRKKVDELGMKIVMDYERRMGREPDDSPSKYRRSVNNYGPGCDIYSKEKEGTIRRIEVKSSLQDIENIELTQSELDSARNCGDNYYIYRVIKLDKESYPEGSEILIYENPYNDCCNISTIKVRMNLQGMKHIRVTLNSTDQ